MVTTVSGVSALEVEKQASSHHEDLEKEDAKAAVADYSGAVAKTNPVEIKLVRKLDTYIMVSDLLFLYFLDHVEMLTRQIIAHSLAHVLAQLP